MSSKHSKLHVLLALHLYFCYCNVRTSAAVPCLPADAAALLQLKRSFVNSNLTSWRAGTDCCRWEAVACDTASGRVIALDLGGRDLQIRGVDPALFNLTGLRNLSMAGNDFMGASLPSFGFELLTEMAHLDFSYTINLFGQIPIGISRLTKLATLDFSFAANLFLEEPSFETFIANLSSLRELYLDGMDISTSGKTWSTALANSTPRLQIISMPYCGLSGSIHQSFSQLHSLVEIDLSSNAVTGQVPEYFADFPLRSLDLSQNNFEGQFSTKVVQLKNLWVLDVSDNPRLSGHLPSFPVGNELRLLVLQNTNFSDVMPASIVNLKSLIGLALTTKGISKQLSLIAKIHTLRLLELQGSGIEKPRFSWIGELRHLEDLSIENYNFSEPIPTWISNLTHLTSLELSNCSLYGSLPSWIGNLTKLTVINFNINYLTGIIPRYVFTIPGIQELYLSYNKFTDYEEIDSPLTSSVSLIDLGGNQLGGSIPQSYLELQSLQGLRLDSNKFTGIVNISSFWRLKGLKELSLSNNMLSVIDEEGNSLFASLQNLRTLELSSCNITKLPDVLRYLDKITSLDLSSNHIKGIIPSWLLENWKDQLSYLNLSHNMFTSIEKLPSFVPMVHLYALDLSNNRLEGNIPIPQSKARTAVLDYSNNYFSSILPDFGKYLSGTTYLDLSKNKLNGSVPTSVCSAKKLHILNLSYNYFSGSIPPCLTERSNLRVLKLRGNQVNGVFLDNISEGCKLQTIDFSNNHIEGKLPRSLTNCLDLGLLDVSKNQIVDSFPSWLSALPHLQVLVLRSNQFSGMVRDLINKNDRNMSHFSSLQILDLASNNFSGNLPQGWFNELKSMMMNNNDQGQLIGQETNSLEGFYQDTITITFKGSDVTFTKILSTFRVIDISNNSFSGLIPESIGRLVSLHGLNMSYNNFTGKIPSHLGNLTQLESMDLSWNHLSGEIPPEFTSLTSLAWLNLSYNNLTGRIPQGNQFLSFPNSSFEGNAGLCGSQISKKCENPASTNPPASNHPESNNLWQDRLEAILLFTFAGLGFGVGFALAIMFEHFYRIDGWICKGR